MICTGRASVDRPARFWSGRLEGLGSFPCCTFCELIYCLLRHSSISCPSCLQYLHHLTGGLDCCGKIIPLDFSSLFMTWDIVSSERIIVTWCRHYLLISSERRIRIPRISSFTCEIIFSDIVFAIARWKIITILLLITYVIDNLGYWLDLDCCNVVYPLLVALLS